MRILYAPDPPVATGAPPIAAPAAPAPAAPASKTEEAPVVGGADDPFAAELEAAFSKDAARNEPPKVDAAASEPKPKAAAAAVKPAAKPAEPVKPAAAAPAAAPNPKALREQLEKVTGELTTSKATMADLERKVKEFEVKGKDTAALLQQLESERKEKDSFLAEIRALKQETTPEFKEKYDAPFNQAAEYAKRAVEGLEKADGQPATWEDFAALYNLAGKSLNKAVSAARETFGDNAQLVIGQLTKLHELDFVKQTALVKEKENWKELSKKDEARAAEQRALAERTQKENQEKFKGIFDKVSQDLESSVEEYRVAPDDKELTEARNKGLAVFDAEPKDGKQFILKQAHVRQRVAAYQPNQIKIARLNKQVADLQAEISELKPTPPAGGKRAGGESHAAPEESWEDGARKAITG